MIRFDTPQKQANRQKKPIYTKYIPLIPQYYFNYDLWPGEKTFRNNANRAWRTASRAHI